MRFISRSIALLAISAAVAGAQNAVPMQAKPLDPANMDTSVSACTDFFQYANGGWVKNNPVPAAFSRWGGFEELAEFNNAALLDILNKAAKDTNPLRSADVRKLGTFYASCMDTAAIERLGVTPVKPELNRIDAISSQRALQQEIGRLHGAGIGALFGFGAAQDYKNATSVIGRASQGGLGLPDRDYYTRTDPVSAALRAKYQQHIAEMLRLSGESAAQAATDAANVLQMETKLANASLTRVQRRDPQSTYNRMTPAELAAMTPHFDWKILFAGEGAPSGSPVSVESPKFFKTVDSLVANQPLDVWKAYLRWHLFNRAAPFLSSAFVNQNFKFTSTLSGAKELQPRNKRCAIVADTYLGDALGQAYVAAHFSPQAKGRALEMVRNMESVFHARIQNAAWMSPATKAAALTKLDAFMNKIGYTDKWINYAPVTIRPRQYLNNILVVRAFDEHRDIRKIGRPVDRTEWGMTPPTVNAYYNPQMNEIVFPAGIMQPPFFNANADDAVNYGGMGSVIGHEMSHGFDDQGSQFDAQGNLRNWWTPEDSAQFARRTGLVASQFAGYTMLDSVHLNGRLTLGENLGDFGGLNVAYAALQKSLTEKGRPGLIDGFSPEQRFFLAWAQIWRQNARPEEVRRRVTIDPHSPGIWRTNGPLSNMPEFAKAFGCKPGDAMVRPDSLRPVIW